MHPLHIPWLEAHAAFPPPEQALGHDTPWPGLLAAGGNLDADTLIAAYSAGIFPWSAPKEPLLWWSTDPRMVLRPGQFKLHKSLGRTLRAFRLHPHAEIRIDTAFEQVMQHCAAPRAGQNGSWITPHMVQAYLELHRRQLAHSVETWVQGQLIGGLYVVALGHAVFGESMFTRQPNASKIALAALVCLCRAHAVALIDCQQQTAHLASLGAVPIPRADFLHAIRHSQYLPAMRWQFSDALWDHLLPTKAQE